MTPIFSILCLIFFFAESIFVLKLASVAEKTGSPLFKSLAALVFFLNLYFLFSATPQLLVREAKLRTLCLEKHTSVKRAKEILDEVSTPCTVQSLVFLPGEKEFWLAQNQNPPVTKGKWVKFNIQTFLPGRN